MKKTFEPLKQNQVFIDNEGGIANIGKADEVSSTGLKISADIFAKAKWYNYISHSQDYTSICYEGCAIGNITNILYSKSDNSFYATFKLFEEGLFGDIGNLPIEHFVCIPYIIADDVSCPECGIKYKKGDELCDCICGAEYIIPDKITITGLFIHNPIDVESYDMKDEIIGNFIDSQVKK